METEDNIKTGINDIEKIISLCEKTNSDVREVMKVYNEAYEEHKRIYGSFKPLLQECNNKYEKMMELRKEYQMEQVMRYITNEKKNKS